MATKNASHSPVLQALKDAASTSTDDVKVRAANDLISSYEKDMADLKRADDRFHAHQYPVKAIKFVMVPTLVGYPAAFWELSDCAFKVLSLLASMCIRGRLVEARSDDLAELLHKSPRTISRAMDDLKDSGFIEVYRKESAQNPPVYLVSEAIVGTGKSPLRPLSGHSPFSVRGSTEIGEWVNVLTREEGESK